MSPFQNILQNLELAIKKKANYSDLLGLFRKMELPINPTSQELTKLYEVMYQLMNFGEKDILFFFNDNEKKTH